MSPRLWTISEARRALQSSLLEPTPATQAARHVHWEPLLVRWRTQLCLLEMFAVVSMLLSVTTDATSLHEGVADGIQNIVRVLDQVIIFAHAIVLTALFGLSEEVNGPLWSRLRRCLAAILVGNSEAEITAFPRSASGFWG